MIANIKRLIKYNTIDVTDDINFDPVELPYSAIGYRFNGSSQSSQENLNLYWDFVDDILLQSNIPTDNYITLQNIVVDDKLYGTYQ